MGNDEGPAGGFPAPVCPHLGRTGLPTHRIRETEARESGEAPYFPCRGSGQAVTPYPQQAHLTLATLPCPIGVKQSLLAKVGSVSTSGIGSATPHSQLHRGYRQPSAMTRKPGGPKHPALHLASAHLRAWGVLRVCFPSHPPGKLSRILASPEGTASTSPVELLMPLPLHTALASSLGPRALGSRLILVHPCVQGPQRSSFGGCREGSTDGWMHCRYNKTSPCTGLNNHLQYLLVRPDGGKVRLGVIETLPPTP